MKPEARMGAGGLTALVLLAVGIVFLALRPGTTEVSVDTSPEVAPPRDGAAVVGFLRQSGGFSLFGLRMVDSTHLVEVRFLADPGCSALLGSGDRWPTPYPECSTDLDVTGEVAGLGVDASGRSLIGVEFPVSAPCYRVLEPGIPWPTGRSECRDG